MCCWQLVFSFFGKSNILISFLQNSINKAYNGMAGACGVSSPGLSPPGAGKDLGCSVPSSASCRLLLPFLAATGSALPRERAWPDTLVLCRAVIPGSLPPPSFSSHPVLPLAALAPLALAWKHLAKPWYISPWPWDTVVMSSCPGHSHPWTPAQPPSPKCWQQ